MSLEDALNENTAAVKALTAAMGKGGAAAGAASTGAARGPGRPKKVSFDEVKAIAKKVMDEKGRPVAVKLIQQHGAPELAALDESKYPAFVAAAEVLLAADPGGEVAETDADL